MGLLDELFHCLSFVTQSDVRTLLYIFSCLSVYTVVHQLEEVLVEVFVGCCSELLIELDIWTEPGCHNEGKYMMDFAEPQSMIEIEFEIQIVSKVLRL